MKICDLTQFYSPVSGGVKRYLAEKSRYIARHEPGCTHLVIVPGERDECRSDPGVRFYTVRSPLLSRTTRYRALLRLSAVREILRQERPDLIETGDPYQVGWQAARSGRELGCPVVAFYHSHFPEAYLRPAERYLGKPVTALLLQGSRRYVRRLYRQYARTLVPSPALAEVLLGWGVSNVAPVDLGVDTDVFFPDPAAGAAVRQELGLPNDAKLLLYVGRLAAEKNTHTLFEAFPLLRRREPQAHLLVIGDGMQRPELERLRRAEPQVHWLPYCGDSVQLAGYYRAATLFVHPGVQETFGLVTLEAQACGAPVAGIRGSYMDRIVYGSQQHWATENTPSALAAAISGSLRAPPEMTPQERGAAIAERYAWPRVFEGLFDLYRQVIAEYRPLSA